MRKTPLNPIHHDLGARMVVYAGWELPLRYRSEIGEHLAVRSDAGMFDVSHMTRIDVQGPESRVFLRHLLANDVASLKPGRALYSCLLNDAGGIVDDLIAGCLEDDRFRLVANAATRAKVLAWIQRHARAFQVDIRPRDDLAMIAVQGPGARNRAEPLLPQPLGERAAALPPFGLAREGGWLVSRTGYTGEDGYEIMLPGDRAGELWHNLLQAGVRPCGLAARDSLRLEAGFNLYGQDMDETTSPLECGLARTVAFEPPERRFIGREALERLRAAGVGRRRVGLVLVEPGVLRAGQRVRLSRGEGKVTSGGFSPLLKRSIALARVPVGSDVECEVEIRRDWRRARIVEPPFVRHGRILINMEQRDE